MASEPACYGNSLGSNPDISQKYKMGDISKEVANTLYPAKKIYKKNFTLNQRQYNIYDQILPRQKSFLVMATISMALIIYSFCYRSKANLFVTEKN